MKESYWRWKDNQKQFTTNTAGTKKQLLKKNLDAYNDEKYCKLMKTKMVDKGEYMVENFIP